MRIGSSSRWVLVTTAALAIWSSCSDDGPTATGGAGGTIVDAGLDRAQDGAGGGAGSIVDSGETEVLESGPPDDGPSDVGEDVVDAPPLPKLGPASVLQHHRNASRDGVYVDPKFTKTKAGMFLDPNFHATIEGPTYSQLLYVDSPDGKDLVIASTEQNKVYGLDATTGTAVWVRTLGAPVARAMLPCGSIDPVGITGTPIIDGDSHTLYVDAMTTPDGGTTKKHLIFALSTDDGSTRPGWPLDVSATVSFGGMAFDSTIQNQRSALALLNGNLYVAYGGHGGDCGNYRGWVVSVPVARPSAVQAFATGTQGGGIWGPSGIASDGTAIFVATGNAFNRTVDWNQSEAILRFEAGATFTGQAKDFFAPSDWYTLDAADYDLGGTGPVVLDVPGATPSKLLVALGKNGVGYLLDRNNLGGFGKGNGMMGEGLSSVRVASLGIINAAAAYTTAMGSYVVFPGAGIGCPTTGNDLVALRVSATAPPQLSVAWCAREDGKGSPFVTTTDGHTDPLVWGFGAEGGGRLWAFDADTGQSIIDGGTAIDPKAYVRRFLPPIVAKGRVFVVADNGVYAFVKT
jgi:outer membrane protein assembly factor BamB